MKATLHEWLCLPLFFDNYPFVQATPVIAGIAVGAAAYAGKAAIELFTKFRNAPPRMRQFYKV